MTEDEASFYVRAAYRAFLGRSGEAAEVQGWARLLVESTGDIRAMLTRFLDSEEYRARASVDVARATSSKRDARESRLPSTHLRARVLGRLGIQSRHHAEESAASVEAKVARCEEMLLLLLIWSAHNSLALERPALEDRPIADVVAQLEPDLSAWLGRQIASSLDPIRKEQIAVAHRLLGLEDVLSALRQSVNFEAVQASAEQVLRHDREIEELRRHVSGFTSDRGSQVTAIESAGLNLARGPYGTFLTIVPDLIGGALERGEFWDTHLRPIFERSADRGKIAIDVGSYIGFHSVFLSKLFRSVHAFEPQTKCFRLLNANLELNRCENVTAHNVAVYDSSREMGLAPPDAQQVRLVVRDSRINYHDLGNAASLAYVAAGGVTGTEVRAVTLDSLIVEDVGLIKIDAQGCDLRVLSGARALIEASRPVITFEFEQDLAKLHGDTWSDFDDFFRAQSYRLVELSRQSATQVDYAALPD